MSYAIALGLDPNTMTASPIEGVGNLQTSAYYTMLDLDVSFCGSQYRYATLVGFADQLPGNVVYWGKSAFLDHFRVDFDQSRSIFYIEPANVELKGTHQISGSRFGVTPHCRLLKAEF